MSAKPPKIVVPGLSRGKGIPTGYFLGRVDGGRGPVQLIRGPQIGRLVPAIAAAQNQLHTAGFTFYAGGLMLNGEDLGSGTWAHPVQFENGVGGTTVTSQVAATSTAVFTIYVLTPTPVAIGTITFAAGSTVGVVNFPVPYTVPAGQAIRLNAPSPADATLASVTGTVVGIDA